MSTIKHCQVLGPFNSGTTLMEIYLRILFRNYSPGVFNYWKHSLPPLWFPRNPSQAAAIELPGTKFPGIILICMVRSPYFWLSSTCQRQYNILFQTSRLDVDSRLRCQVSLRGQQFENIVQLWNNYYRRYTEQLEVHQPIEYVRLEDLVKAPIETLRGLESILERRPESQLEPTIARLSSMPAKPGNAYGVAWKEKNRLEHLADTMSRRNLEFITEQLDASLMKKFGYSRLWFTPQIS